MYGQSTDRTVALKKECKFLLRGQVVGRSDEQSDPGSTESTMPPPTYVQFIRDRSYVLHTYSLVVLNG